MPGVRLSGRWKTDGDGPERLRIDGPGRLDGVVRFREIENELIFRVRGRIAGRRVRARVRIHSCFIEPSIESESGGEAGRLASRGPRRSAVPAMRRALVTFLVAVALLLLGAAPSAEAELQLQALRPDTASHARA